MPRIQGAELVYDTADDFRQRCLLADLSLLWPAAATWTTEGCETLTTAILDYPEKEKASFLEKLRRQLNGKPVALYRLAADALVMYYVFDSWTRPATKVAAVEAVVSWSPDSLTVPHSDLERRFSESIGGAGTHYATAQHREMVFFLEFARRVKVNKVNPNDDAACQQLADDIRSQISGTGEARHILLHLLFPDKYEPIASQGNKQAIRATFADKSISPQADLDKALLTTRERLSPEYGNGFSFYQDDVKKRWSPGEESEPLKASFEHILRTYKSSRETAPFSSEHPIYAEFQRATQLLARSPSISGNPHLKVKFSAGQGNWARVPWIAVMDDRETTSTQRGLYCVYLFREDGSGLYVTLNQGVTEPQRQLGVTEGKKALRERAAQMRGRVRSLTGRGYSLSDDIDLKTGPGLGSDYEVSTIAHKLYRLGAVPPDSDLIGDLEAVVSAYEEALEATTEPTSDLAEIYSSFAQTLETAKLHFGRQHEQVVRSFLASLLTRPFVILTGLSGSGKTQIALQFGDWLGVEYSRIVSVRPDWTGSDAIFGYVDILRAPAADGRRAWFVPETMQFLLKAARDPSRPYLLILDEMNLAHVERYFADFLSGMESDRPVLANLVKEGQDWRESANDPPLPIPTNLIVVGTVNVDETTYMFSPKVLDRANTIEFRVQSGDLSPAIIKPPKVAPARASMTQGLLQVATDDDWQLAHRPAWMDDYIGRLTYLHSILSELGAEFGYRTYYDAIRFAAIYAELGDPSWENALDLQVLQKILPRMHGARRKLEPILAALGRFCFDFGRDQVGATQFDPVQRLSTNPKLPNSLEKIRRMTINLRANQFASFAE